MKNYSGKEKLRSVSGMLLAVFFTSMLVFIMSSGYAQGEDKAAIECYKETAKTVVSLDCCRSGRNPQECKERKGACGHDPLFC